MSFGSEERQENCAGAGVAGPLCGPDPARDHHPTGINPVASILNWVIVIGRRRFDPELGNRHWAKRASRNEDQRPISSI
jgi:hypothetical protein